MKIFNFFKMILVFILFLNINYSCEETDLEIDFVTDYDGNTYKTIKIGNQIWMAENLKTTHYADGTPIILFAEDEIWRNLDYDFKAMYMSSTTYGALYNWKAATNGEPGIFIEQGMQGVCPDGWHLPSDKEWIELEINLGMNEADVYSAINRGTNQGSKLAGDKNKWKNGVLEDDADFGKSGFMALPGTFINELGLGEIGSNAFFWTATEVDSLNAYQRYIRSFSSELMRMKIDKKYGYSVRCVKNN